MSSPIRATSLQGIDTLIKELGGDFAQALDACNVRLNFKNLEDEYLPYRQYAQLLEYCSDEYNCPSFGLRLANKQEFEILGHIAIAAKSSTNIEEAINWVKNYLHLHSPALTMNVQPLENTQTLFLSFEINLSPQPLVNQALELTLGLACKTLKELSNNQCKPMQVFLPQKLAVNSYAYNAFFGCPVVEDRNCAGIVINKQHLALKLSISSLSKTQATFKYLAQYGAHTQPLPEQVIALIKPMLSIHQCSNLTIATALGMHPRTLHRALAKHNTSFVKLKDQTRRTLAEYYLRQNHHCLATISELLGYQEQATLCASIKRWFGCSARILKKRKMLH